MYFVEIIDFAKFQHIFSLWNNVCAYPTDKDRRSRTFCATLCISYEAPLTTHAETSVMKMHPWSSHAMGHFMRATLCISYEAPLTTHAETSVTKNASMIFARHAAFHACLSSRSDHSRCRWHMHLANHGYFDYRKNTKTPNWSPMLGRKWHQFLNLWSKSVLCP